MISSFQCEINGDNRISPDCLSYSDTARMMSKLIISGDWVWASKKPSTWFSCSITVCINGHNSKYGSLYKRKHSLPKPYQNSPNLPYTSSNQILWAISAFCRFKSVILNLTIYSEVLFISMTLIWLDIIWLEWKITLTFFWSSRKFILLSSCSGADASEILFTNSSLHHIFSLFYDLWPVFALKTGCLKGYRLLAFSFNIVRPEKRFPLGLVWKLYQFHRYTCPARNGFYGRTKPRSSLVTKGG